MKCSAFLLATLSAVLTSTCYGNTLNIGIIYDNELGISGEALMRRFNELRAKMEYYADYPIRNFSLPSPPPLNITINEFTVGQACNLIQNNVHVIISLTICSVAQLIESQTSPHRITHVAIPRPACSRDSIDSSALSDSTTIWIQPTPEHTSRAIYELSETERAALALLLSDSPTLEVEAVLDLILQSEMNNEKFVPYFSTQMYSNHNLSNIFYPTSSIHRTVDDLLNRVKNSQKQISSKFLLTHIFQLQVKPLDPDQLYSIFQNRYIFKNFYWIFATTLSITPNELIRVAMTNQKEQVATGFYRQFPILNEEDCLNLEIGENMRLLMEEIFQCNTYNITERELEAVYMILLSSQTTILMKSLSLDILNTPVIQNCGSNVVQTKSFGQLFYRILISLAEFPKWKDLLFYALETNKEGVSKFYPTGKFGDNENAVLNDRARFVAKQSLLSGLFPNVFRTFQNQTLNVSTVIEAPYVMGGRVTKDLELIGARGLVIDILNEFARRLEFSYRLFLPPDGEYGAKISNTTWSGMIGELLAKRTDIIAAPLTVNDERSGFVYYVGPFMEDTMGILIKVPDQNEELFQMFLPFRYDIWLCLVASVFIAALAITLFSIISPFSAWNLALPGATSDEVSIYHSIWFTVGGMLMQGQELRAIAGSARTVTLLYWLLVLVIQATWQADLTAFLTRNVVQIPVSSLDDLANSGYTVAARENSGLKKIFERGIGNPVYSKIFDKISKNGVDIISLDQSVEFVRNSTYNVFLGNRITLLHYPYAETDTLDVVEVKDIVIPLSFAVRLDEEYASLMLNFMSTLRERGVIDHLLEKWDVEKSKIVANTASYNSVTLRNISGAFIVLSVFIVVSLIVLVIEKFWYKHALNKASLNPKGKETEKEGHPGIWRRFTHPSAELPKPKLDLSRNPTLKQLRYAGHRRASAAFDATVITADHHHTELDVD
ncbi:unnamed protein product [Trichobilharzia szidati]|nr:unnamed protein product [Trichobilharzia szidati]